MPGRNGVIRRWHRFVVLPDYQGIGIAKRLINMASEKLFQEGYKNISYTTSHKFMAKSQMRDRKWILTHAGHLSPHTSGKFNRTGSHNRNTYSFRYIGDRKTENA
jgi:GNAT superfamily N-acetyltransferase